MALIRWNPSSELMNLHSEMDRLFGELTEGLGVQRAQGNGGGTDAPVFLPLDIERTDKELIIHASVPGFRPEDVNVTVDNGVLTIDARRETHSEEKKKKNFIRQERFMGRLFRQIALGDGVKGDDAKATFKDGVLTVTVPLVERPQPKKIPVQASKEG